MNIKTKLFHRNQYLRPHTPFTWKCAAHTGINGLIHKCQYIEKNLQKAWYSCLKMRTDYDKCGIFRTVKSCIVRFRMLILWYAGTNLNRMKLFSSRTHFIYRWMPVITNPAIRYIFLFQWLWMCGSFLRVRHRAPFVGSFGQASWWFVHICKT